MSKQSSFNQVNAWVIIPEGLAAKASRTLEQPSFVYEHVLNWILANAEQEDVVYLAPANHFGGALAEDEVAENFLRKACARFTVKTVKGIDRSQYIDTMGNAVILGKHFPELFSQKVSLVCGRYHRLRSYLCFAAIGFKINKVIGVKYYSKDATSQVVKRLFFYRYYPLHVCYEAMALLRDGLRIIGARGKLRG